MIDYEMKLKELPHVTDRYVFAGMNCEKKLKIKGGVKFVFDDGSWYSITYEKEVFSDGSENRMLV